MKIFFNNLYLKTPLYYQNSDNKAVLNYYNLCDFVLRKRSEPLFCINAVFIVCGFSYVFCKVGEILAAIAH